MARPISLIPVGTKFGRLTVKGPAGMRGRNATSLCECECGTVKAILNLTLKSGGTQSCGCLARERASARVKENPPRLKHGGKRTITYNSWQGMVSRCLNEKDWKYKRYGGRGITVCRRWSDPDSGFLNFLEDMGQRPSSAHSIDRINNDGNYEPGNCRWATRAQQNQNVGLKKSNSSGYKGIRKSRRRWYAEIRCDGRRIKLGSYRTAVGAALAYNIASEKLHGEFGVRNALPQMSKRTTNIVFRRVTSILTGETFR